ncbi:MAG: sigma-70 family RNA polymerase sigma factor [Phycisphaeraceae bacterium]
MGSSSEVQSSLQIYLRQINEVPLLTAQEEKDLARQILEHGCAASRDRMIRANLRLVVAIAKRFGNRGMALADLIEEGNIGLLRAVETFDPEQGARFSTYGSWWIKQAIKRSLINAVQPIHVPAYMVELIAKWKKVSREMEEHYGRQPSLQELADAMELPAKKVRIIRKAVRASQRPSQGPVSRDGQSMSLGEMLEDDRTPAPDESMETMEEIAAIRELLDAIDQRDATILRLRYGLDGDEPMTLKEIGKVVGLTRERVRQLEIAALQKLHQRMRNRRDAAARRGKRYSENGSRQRATGVA